MIVLTYKKFLEKIEYSVDLKIPTFKDFIEYVSGKLQINIKYDTMISGGFGYIFEIDKYRVIKISQSNINGMRKLVNHNIEGVVKVYSVGVIKIPSIYKRIDRKEFDNISSTFETELDNTMELSYLIMENLEPLSTVNKNMFYKIIETIRLLGVENKWWERYTSIYSKFVDISIESDLANIVRQNLSSAELKMFDILVSGFNGLYKLNLKNEDFGYHNLMQDYNGNIKMIDISENEDLSQGAPRTYKPKHFIKENKNS